MRHQIGRSGKQKSQNPTLAQMRTKEGKELLKNQLLIYKEILKEVNKSKSGPEAKRRTPSFVLALGYEKNEQSNVHTFCNEL